MIPLSEHAPHVLILVAGALFGLAIVASLWRLLAGPTLPDRVIALDVLGFLVVGLVCIVAIATEQPSLLGVALVAALILFLGTAAFAIYLERSGSASDAA